MRDNMRMRRLVKSEWYQTLWPLALAPDQDAKLKFENAATGFRAAVAATAMTGHRGDRVLYDDPHSVEGALSDVQRTDGAAGVRRDRDHPAQLAGALGDRRGHAAAARAGPVRPYPRARARLRAPLPADGVRGGSPVHDLDRLRGSAAARRASCCSPSASRPRSSPATSRPWAISATAGQFQQRPTPRGGGMFPTDRFVLIDHPPEPADDRRPRSATGTRPAPRTAAPSPPAS